VALDSAPAAAVDWGRVIGPLRTQVQEAVTSKQLPDLQLAFARDRKIVWTEVFHGQANGSCGKETRFRIGSVAKCITATALLKLVEEGRIDLDRPITDYFPCDVPEANRMTARLLAGHLAGIRHYQGKETLNTRHYESLPSGLAIFSSSPLVASPGTMFHYSSYGFNLLGCVMEAATREKFPALVDEQVLKPLGMSHTEVDDLTKGLQGLAPTYVRAKDGSVVAVNPTDDSYKWPSGGYVSTAEDLIVLGNCYLGPGFLSEASLKAAETSQTTLSGKPTGYSLGWFVSHNADGTVVLSHEGEAVGGEALLFVNPAKKAVFAAVWDVSQVEITPLLDRVGRELAEAK